jgi:hypothetical protein
VRGSPIFQSGKSAKLLQIEENAGDLPSSGSKALKKSLHGKIDYIAIFPGGNSTI